MKYRVVHRTEYVYTEPVTLCHNEAHLTPRTFAGQRLTSHALDIEPRAATLSRRDDFFGNAVVYFAVQASHPVLRVTARSEVERDPPPSYEDAAMPWDEAAAHTARAVSADGIEARQFRLDSPMVAVTDDVRAYARPSFPAGRPLAEAAADLTARVHRDFAYEPGATTIATPLVRVLGQRRGVCQDFAHVAIACLRAMGLGARYVSGYLETEPADGEERLVGADASHAWFAVWSPDAGWLDFDPTNDGPLSERHITTAWGRDYADVTPLKGIIFGGGASHTATVSVDVARVAA